MTNRRMTLTPRGLTALITALLVVVTSLVMANPASAVGIPGRPTLEVVATCIKASWTAVPDATGYQVQYSTSSTFPSTSTTTVAATTTSVYANTLVGGSTYYFRVAATNGSATSTWSSATSAKAVLTHPAPTNVAVDNANGTSIELSWTGTLSTWAYKIRARSSGNPDVWADASGTYTTITGLKKSTDYEIRVYSARSEMDGWPSIILGPGSTTLSATTSSYDLGAPQNFRATAQRATAVDLAWDVPDGMQTGWRYQVQRALNTAMTKSMVWSAPVSTNSLTLSGLAENTPYYVRLRVIDANGNQRSDRTGYIMAKSIIARGSIKGTVTGAPAGDLVVGAYDTSNELADRASVNASGEFTLRVRPGTYRVRANYVGTGAYTGAWARAGSTGGLVASAATAVTVAADQTVNAPAIALVEGASVGGVIKDPSGNPVADVDVSVLTGWTSEREVVTSSVSNSNGEYTVVGLRDGDYWLRMIYSGDGFQVRSIAFTLTQGKIVSVRVSTSPTPVVTTPANPFLAINARLDLADWYRRYGSRIEGSKRVGATLTAVAPPWVAGTYPASYGTRTIVWKRNGVAIATGTRYTLTRADKGRRISITATFRKYGYVVGSTTSKSYYVY